jgi:hypothetical protein
VITYAKKALVFHIAVTSLMLSARIRKNMKGILGIAHDASDMAANHNRAG